MFGLSCLPVWRLGCLGAAFWARRFSQGGLPPLVVLGRRVPWGRLAPGRFGPGARDPESRPETPLRRSPQRREAPGRWALAAARSTELRPRSHKVTQIGAGLGFKNPKWRSTVRLALLWPVGWLRAALPGFRFFAKLCVACTRCGWDGSGQAGAGWPLRRRGALRPPKGQRT